MGQERVPGCESSPVLNPPIREGGLSTGDAFLAEPDLNLGTIRDSVDVGDGAVDLDHTSETASDSVGFRSEFNYGI